MQPAFEMVQRKTILPFPIPVTVVLGLVGVVIVAVPLMRDHIPVPTTAAFPARDVDEEHNV